MLLSRPIAPALSRRYALILLLTSLASLLITNAASAGITVFDVVVPAGKPVKLSALTKGMLFPEGGRLVTFYAGEKKIGTTLSGGDGYAYLKYTPSAPGAVPLKATSGEDSDLGVVLVTGRKEGVIIIEIEGALFDSMLSFKPAEHAPSILGSLPDRIRILYTTTLIGIAQSRNWLKEHHFPPSPVIQWGGAAMIADLEERGITISAVIASPDRLSEVIDVERRFSFQETENGTVVKDWDELVRRLEEKERK